MDTLERREYMRAYQKEWREKNKERLSAQAKEYYAKNKQRWFDRTQATGYRERKAANARRFRQNNPAKVKAAKHRYYEDNKAHVNKKAAEWRRLNPEKRKAIAIAWNRRHPDQRKHYQLVCLYGISLDEYRSLLSEQGGKCALCRRAKRRLCVDHCHDTGVVRGLLCVPCNGALGKLGDTSESLARAVAYLAAAERREVVACA